MNFKCGSCGTLIAPTDKCMWGVRGGFKLPLCGGCGWFGTTVEEKAMLKAKYPLPSASITEAETEMPPRTEVLQCPKCGATGKAIQEATMGGFHRHCIGDRKVCRGCSCSVGAVRKRRIYHTHYHSGCCCFSTKEE